MSSVINSSTRSTSCEFHAANQRPTKSSTHSMVGISAVLVVSAIFPPSTLAWFTIIPEKFTIVTSRVYSLLLLRQGPNRLVAPLIRHLDIHGTFEQARRHVC